MVLAQASLSVIRSADPQQRLTPEAASSIVLVYSMYIAGGVNAAARLPPDIPFVADTHRGSRLESMPASSEMDDRTCGRRK